MKSRPACLPCLLQQSYMVARGVSEDDWSRRKVLGEVMRLLHDVDLARPPAEVVAEVIDLARFGKVDPYLERRQGIHELLRTQALEFRTRLQTAEDPLALAALGAAAANLVDALVLRPELNPSTEFEALLSRGFAEGSVDDLRALLKRGPNVVYLLDNAGEVHFDVLLIEQLRATGATVRAVAKGAGLLHDVTVKEAVDAGLRGVIEVEVPVDEAVSGESLPALGEEESTPDLFALPPGVMGLPPNPSNPSLGELLADAHLVIAKGAAHYETYRSSRVPVVHLLRVKCEPVARSLGVTVGDLVLHAVAPAP